MYIEADMTNSDCRKIEDSESTSWSWLVPFLNFWVTMATVALLGYGITPVCCERSSYIAPLLGPGWAVAGLLAAVTVGFISEFLVESPSLSGLASRTRIRLAILATLLVCAGSICVGIRYVIWASNQPQVS